MQRRAFFLHLAGAIAAASAASLAQTKGQYRARLSTVPIDVAMQATIAGSGAVTATLAGTRLAVSGTYTGLKSAATVAHIHEGPKGVPGPPVFDLTVSGGTSGNISGTLTLTADQAENLAKGRYYVQLHSEKAPDGNLRGWLLPVENRR
jgi:CHRD domain